MNEASNHPWWCGAHPDYNYNTDWCDNCNDEANDWDDEGCLERHPQFVVHKRELRVPEVLGWRDGDYLWLSQKFGEANPRLWRAVDSLNETDAEETDAVDFRDLLDDLIVINKAIKELS